MAERDQLVRSLGRHRPGDAGSTEHVTLLGVARQHEIESLRRHHHAALSDGLALGRRLGRHIDHARFPATVEMTELRRARHRSLRGAEAALLADERTRRSLHVALAHEAFADKES